jgi:CubicO group peptidase (beta-lactamase class C family)
MLRSGAEFPNVHSLLIVKDGRLLYEEYFAGQDRRYGPDGELHTVDLEFDRDTLHDIRSAGKSVTSALVGIAVDSEAIPSLDVPIADYFPEHSASNTPRKRQITLRHALTMSAGLDWNELDVPYTDPANDSERMSASHDPVSFLLGREVTVEPGTEWYYNSGLPLLLGFVISRATERSFGDYAREALFEPLGITDVEWSGSTAWSEIPELGGMGCRIHSLASRGEGIRERIRRPRVRLSVVARPLPNFTG